MANVFGLLAQPINLPASFRTITTDDGLSNNLINAIYKDSRGFVWLGTQSGLNRFDGLNIKKYEMVGNDPITCICEINPYDLLIGTETGLKKLHRKSGEVENIALNSKQMAIHAIASIDGVRFLIATEQGLFILGKKNKTERIAFDNGISASNNITGIAAGYKGDFWLSSQKGLCYYNVNRKQPIVYKANFNEADYNNFTSAVFVDSVVYLGTFSKGLLKFSIRSRRFEKVQALSSDYILNLSRDKQHLYIGTNGNGVKVYSLVSGSVSTISHQADDPLSISSNAIYSFLHDRNSYWIGTYMHGLSYNPHVNDNFKTYSFSSFNSLNYNIRSFSVGNGEMMIGTRSGLIFISERSNLVRVISKGTNSILTSNIILFIHPFQGKYLIGTYGGGMYVFNPVNQQLSRFSNEEVFVSGCIFRIANDSRNQLWIATDKGLFCIDPVSKNVKKYDVTNSGLTNNTIISLCCDSRNRVWLGTLDGLCVLDNTTGIIRSDILPKEFSAISRVLRPIQNIYEDSKKNIWICTYDGVIRINESLSAIRRFTVKDFLPDNIVRSVIEDGSGNLWFATAKGIVKYNQKTGGSIGYTIADGITGYDFTNVVQKTSDGRFWWANEKGLLYCSATAFANSNEFAKPVITGIIIANKEYDPEDKRLIAPEYMDAITLSSSENSIGFRFSFLNYSLPKSDIFEYMLEGYDKTWQKQIGSNEVYYSKLHSGTYVFRVRVAGQPSTETHIKVRVNPDFMIFIWILLTIAAVVVTFRLNRNRIRKLVANQAIKKDLDDEKYKNSKLKQQDAELITKQLEKFLIETKSYLNPDLKQSDIASAISCSSTDLSQVLSQYLNTSFTDYVNRYRIEEFKCRVKQKNSSKYTLAALSEQCGFSSRTSFFRALKKQTGQTPLEYLKSINRESEIDSIK
jgi:Two component regulator propeller./Bacterial regulatory helix-turn-helix proteins, AraC family./Y_Y_Y domain.